MGGASDREGKPEAPRAVPAVGPSWSPNAIAAEAFTVFASAFAPYARERLREAYGEGWEVELGFRSSTGLGNSKQHQITDVAELLGLLASDPIRDKALRPRSPEGWKVRNTARDAREYRNDSAHQDGTFGSSEAVLAINALRDLATWYDLDGIVPRLNELLASLSEVIATTTSPVGSLESYRSYVTATVAWSGVRGLSRQVPDPPRRAGSDELFIEPRLSIESREPAPDALVSLAGRQTNQRVWKAIELSALVDIPHYVLVGAPGSGKSTLLRHLVARAVAAPSGARSVPILARADEYARRLIEEPGVSLRRFLVSRNDERWSVLLARAIEDGTASVVIDGLDEVGDLGLGRQVVDGILRFSAQHPSIPITVSTRPHGYRHDRLASRFLEVRLEAFDSKRISAFLHRWAAETLGLGSEPADVWVNGLEQRIERDDAVKELASVPLTLEILCRLASTTGSIPAGRGGLFGATVDTMLRDWPTERFGRRFEPSTYLEPLRAVAWDMVAAGEATIGEEAVLGRLTAHFAATAHSSEDPADRARDLLDAMEERTGFFVEVGRTGLERWYGFQHRSFGEYLAALEIARRSEAAESDWEPILNHDRWEQSRSFLLDIAATWPVARATRLIKAMSDRRRPSEVVIARGPCITLAALARGVHLEPDFVERCLSEAVTQYLRSPAFGTCRRILGAVEAAGDAGALRPDHPVLVDDPRDTPAQQLRRLILRGQLGVLPPGELARIPRLAAAPELDDLSLELVRFYVLRQSALAEEPEFDSLSKETDRTIGISPYLLRVSGLWWRVEEAHARPFLEAGWPRLTVGEAYADPSRLEQGPCLLVDRSALAGQDTSWQPTLDQYLAFAEGCADLDVFIGLVPDTPWHERHHEEIASLVQVLPSVSTSVMRVFTYIFALQDISPRWIPVRDAMASRGSETQQLAALATIPAWPAEATAVDLLALGTGGSEAVRYAVAGVADASVARAVLESEPQPWIRGAAVRRLIALQFDRLSAPRRRSTPDTEVVRELTSRSEFLEVAPSATWMDEDLDAMVGVIATAAARSSDAVAESLYRAGADLLAVHPQIVGMEPLGPSAYAVGENDEVYLRQIGLACLQAPRPATRLSGIRLLLPAKEEDRPILGRALLALLEDEDRQVAQEAVWFTEDVPEEPVLRSCLSAMVDLPPEASDPWFRRAIGNTFDQDVASEALMLLDLLAEPDLDAEHAADLASWAYPS